MRILIYLLIIYAHLCIESKITHDEKGFGMDYIEPQKEMNTRQFRDYMNKNVGCYGSLCESDGTYGNNYDVDHIIDKRAGGKDIAGNYVMSEKKFNRGLGGKSYEESYKIKENSYGIDRMNAAKKYNRRK
jgi:hypothetical protein